MISLPRSATLIVCLFTAHCVPQLAWAQHPVIIAHRGNSLFAPENTVAACEAARGVADMVEFDVRASADGALILMHDADLERTAQTASPVTAETFASLRGMEVGAWFAPQFAGEPIATLEETLEAILPDMVPLIERKTGSAAAYVETLQRMGVEHDVVLQAFNWDFLAEVHAIDPTIRLAALGSEDLTEDDIVAIDATGAQIVAWHSEPITEREVELVHAWGMQLYVWTVDGGRIPQMLDLGVDGLITNDPAMATALRDGGEVDEDALGEGLIAHLASGEFAGQPVEIDPCVNTLTLAAWVRLDRLPSEQEADFVGLFDSSEDSFVLYLDRESGQLRFKVTDDQGFAARPGIPESDLSVGSWHHVVGVYNGAAGPATGQALVYLDGRLMDAHTGPDGDENQRWGLTGALPPQVAFIGRNGASDIHLFGGGVGDIDVWARALSPSEVAALSALPVAAE